MRIRTAIRLFVWGLILLAIGVAIKLIGPQVSPERLRQAMSEELARATGADVSVASVRLGLNGVLHAKDVVITPPGQQTPLFSCPEILIALDKTELLRMRAVIERVALRAPVVHLLYLEDKGAWNFALLQVGRTAGSRPPKGLLRKGAVVDDGVVRVQHAPLFGDARARTYPGLRLQLRPTEPSGETWTLRGGIQGGLLADTRLSGWYRSGQAPQFALDINCQRLRANRDLWEEVPYGKFILSDYSPEGHVSVWATLCSGTEGSLDFSLRGVFTEGTAKTKYFPFRASSVNGTVEVTPTEVFIKDMTCVIPSTEFGALGPTPMPAQVRMNGVYHLPNRGGSFDISVMGLPVCQRVVESIPEVGQAVWERLKPTGRARLSVSLTEPPNGELQFTTVTDLEDGTLHPQELPFPLEQVSGTIVVDNGGLRLRNLRGVVVGQGAAAASVKPTAPFSADGLVSFRGQESALSISVHGLRTDEKGVKSIPGVGPQLWGLLRPEVALDASVVLRDVLDPKRMSYSALLEVHSGRCRPALPAEALGSEGEAGEAPRVAGELPVTLEQVNGNVVVDTEGVRLRDVRGMIVQPHPSEGSQIQEAPFSADGLVDLQGRKSSLSVTVHNLQTNEKIVRAVPLGDKVWQLFHPKVVADASVQLRDAPEAGRMAYSVLIELHGGRIEPQFCSIPLTDTIGTIKVDGAKVSIERFTATVDTGESAAEKREQTISTMDMRGKLDLEANQAELYVNAKDLTVTKNLLAAVPQVGAEVWQQAAPRGLASFTGKISYDGSEEDPLHYMLDVDLVDISLVPKFIPVPVDALSGKLLVTESRTVSNNFTGVTCGGRFQGSAVVYYGAAGEATSYGARVQYEQLELGELAKRAGGKETNVAGRLAGVIDVGGAVGQTTVTGGKGSVSLTDGRLWRTSFFLKLLPVLHLSMPTNQEAPLQGEMTFALAGNELKVREFELVGGGLNLSGYGTIGLDGKLNLTIVAVGAPEEGMGIPIVTPVVNLLLKAVERQLVRLDVTGPINDPIFEQRVLSKIAWPLTSLRSVLFSPILGGGTKPQPEQ